MGQTSNQVTRLLQLWSDGDKIALEKLTPIVFQELHRLAHRYMSGEKQGHLLQTTALINEAYIRLTGLERMDWQNRTHFYAVASQMMRRILVDFARSQKSLKRGGKASRVSIDDIPLVSEDTDLNLVALDDALQVLSDVDERKCKVVELRFFGGLSVAETAEVLKVSPDTVLRDWRLAKVWLRREMTQSG
jgi:RNA polymerase sigma factor (TIGR02999 family)